MSKSADAFRTISEVADWLGVQAHVLRFWESKFTQIKPVKRAGGRRYYRPADMLLLGGIRKLLHKDGLTIKEVQAILRDLGIAHVSQLSHELDADGPPEDTHSHAPLPASSAAAAQSRHQAPAPPAPPNDPANEQHAPAPIAPRPNGLSSTSEAQVGETEVRTDALAAEPAALIDSVAPPMNVPQVDTEQADTAQANTAIEQTTGESSLAVDTPVAAPHPIPADDATDIQDTFVDESPLEDTAAESATLADPMPGSDISSAVDPALSDTNPPLQQPDVATEIPPVDDSVEHTSTAQTASEPEQFDMLLDAPDLPESVTPPTTEAVEIDSDTLTSAAPAPLEVTPQSEISPEVTPETSAPQDHPAVSPPEIEAAPADAAPMESVPAGSAPMDAAGIATDSIETAPTVTEPENHLSDSLEPPVADMGTDAPLELGETSPAPAEMQDQEAEPETAPAPETSAAALAPTQDMPEQAETPEEAPEPDRSATVLALLARTTHLPAHTKADVADCAAELRAILAAG